MSGQTAAAWESFDDDVAAGGRGHAHTTPTRMTVSEEEAMVRAFLDAHHGDITKATVDWRRIKAEADAQLARDLEAAGNYQTKRDVQPLTAAERQELDRILADRLANKATIGAVTRRREDAPKGRAYALAALDAEAAAVASAPVGLRNHTLNTAAWTLSRPELEGLLDPDEIEDVLTTAGMDAGLPEREARAVVCSALRKRNRR